MEKKINIVCFLVLIASFAFGGTFHSDSLVKHLPKHFNGQVYITQKDSTLCNYYNGFTNRTYGGKINDSTLFNVGEISHSFVYYFIEHLASLNQIKRSDQVVKYIPNFPYSDITIDHLVNHQSGLPQSYVKFYYKKKYSDMNVKVVDKAVRFDNADLIDLIAKKKPKLSFTPGDSVEISDLNYLLLTSLIEKVTFTPYKDFVERMFKHQNFDFTPKTSANSDTLPHKAYGYRLLRDSSIVPCENLNSIGFNFSDGTNGNQHLYLSAKSMNSWGKYLLNKMDSEIISKNSSTQFFGNFQYDKQWEVIVSKGAFGGTYSHLIYIPSNGINLAITNSLLSQENLNKLVEYLKTVDNL